MKALVTGGAGFIGSHIVDRLVARGDSVTVYDNFSTGRAENLSGHAPGPAFRTIQGDTRDLARLCESTAGHEAVFHFQANADVRGGIDNTRADLEQNTIATWNVLEAARLAGVRLVVFASSATIYGEPGVFPTPEDCPRVQTSLYAASKVAGEAMIEAYAEYFDMTCLAFRFVSWIGPRYSHGVIFDFVKKLLADPKELEVLGDGNQKKSYLDVRDGVEGVFTAVDRCLARKGVFNLGHDDIMNVLDLAAIVTAEMGLSDVSLRLVGGKRGWLGDSPFVHVDTSRIKALGWRPRIPIAEGIRATVRHLLQNPGLLR